MPTPAHTLLVLALVMALPGRGAPPPPSTPPLERPTSTMRDSVRLLVDAPERVAPGAPVPIRLVLENASDAPETVYLTGRPIAFDVVVEDSAGRDVWTRLAGETMSMVLQMVELAPGERREFRAEWDQRDAEGAPVGPGEYRLRGRLSMEAGAWMESEPVTLRIGPPHP